MTISDWLLGTCGRSHIGVYSCSRCGYELLHSGFRKTFVLKPPNWQGLFPLPVTPVAAQKGQLENGQVNKTKRNIVSTQSFRNSMLKDLTKNMNLGRTFHKNSLVKRIMDVEECIHGAGSESQTKYQISCGKCGSSLGHQTISADGGTSSEYFIERNTIDLTFRTT